MPRVVQVSCYVDPDSRPPEALLACWPALSDAGTAAAAAGWDVAVVQAAVRDQVLEHAGVPFHFVGERQPSRLRRRLGPWAAPLTRRTVQRVADLSPDVVHLHGLSFPVHAHYLRERLPRAEVLVQDHADRLPPAWRRPVHRWGLAHIGGVAFTTRAQAAPFFQGRVFSADLPVYEVLPFSSRFTPGEQTRARAVTGLFGDPCLLWLGHLDANKDPLTVLAALSRVAADVPHTKLWCCYRRAPLLGRVRERIAADPMLAERVHLLGPRPHADVESLVRSADFLVQGSHAEASGMVVLEALACGTTPLVTDIPSFRRFTDNGAVGALSPPGDAAAMGRAIVEWSRRDRVALRRAARAHFERALSVRAAAADLDSAYKGLLERR